MKGLKHTIEHYKKLGIGNETHMFKSVDLIDEMILHPLMETHPQIYWDFMRQMQQIYMGAHYDEEFAKWEVENMSHKGADGVEYKGQHWSLEDAAQVHAKYKTMLKPTDNVYDVYVALNSQYHDLCTLYKEWFGDKYEDHIILAAINYFFKDSDAPEGKIWHYYDGMREGMEHKK